MTPSKRRRVGREAYCPGAGADDADLLNPYLNEWKDCWGAESNAEHWRDGWNEAQKAYEAEQRDKPELHWVMGTFADETEELIGEVTFDSSNPPTELEIDGITYKPEL